MAVCRDRSTPTAIDHGLCILDYLFLFPSRSESMNETRRGREGIFRSFSSKNLLFTNTSPSTKFISLFLCFRKLEILLLSVESKKRFGDTSTGPQHLENGRGIFRSVSGNVCKVTSGNSRAGATRSEPLRGSVRDVVEEEEGGMLEQELSRAVARDTARNPV